MPFIWIINVESFEPRLPAILYWIGLGLPVQEMNFYLSFLLSLYPPTTPPPPPTSSTILAVFPNVF